MPWTEELLGTWTDAHGDPVPRFRLEFENDPGQFEFDPDPDFDRYGSTDPLTEEQEKARYGILLARIRKEMREKSAERKRKRADESEEDFIEIESLSRLNTPSPSPTPLWSPSPTPPPLWSPVNTVEYSPSVAIIPFLILVALIVYDRYS